MGFGGWEVAKLKVNFKQDGGNGKYRFRSSGRKEGKKHGGLRSPVSHVHGARLDFMSDMSAKVRGEVGSGGW